MESDGLSSSSASSSCDDLSFLASAVAAGARQLQHPLLASYQQNVDLRMFASATAGCYSRAPPASSSHSEATQPQAGSSSKAKNTGASSSFMDRAPTFFGGPTTTIANVHRPQSAGDDDSSIMGSEDERAGSACAATAASQATDVTTPLLQGCKDICSSVPQAFVAKPSILNKKHGANGNGSTLVVVSSGQELSNASATQMDTEAASSSSSSTTGAAGDKRFPLLRTGVLGNGSAHKT